MPWWGMVRMGMEPTFPLQRLPCRWTERSPRIGGIPPPQDEDAELDEKDDYFPLLRDDHFEGGEEGEGGKRSRDELLGEYKLMTNDLLPTEARRHTGQPGRRWPIRLNHCFQRVILDNLFNDVWYGHLPAAAPSDDGEQKSTRRRTAAKQRQSAMSMLTAEQLERALAIGRRMLEGGAPVVRELNERSLAWRGKQRRPTASAATSSSSPSSC